MQFKPVDFTGLSTWEFASGSNTMSLLKTFAQIDAKPVTCEELVPIYSMMKYKKDFTPCYISKLIQQYNETCEKFHCIVAHPPRMNGCEISTNHRICKSKDRVWIDQTNMFMNTPIFGSMRKIQKRKHQISKRQRTAQTAERKRTNPVQRMIPSEDISTFDEDFENLESYLGDDGYFSTLLMEMLNDFDYESLSSNTII